MLHNVQNLNLFRLCCSEVYSRCQLERWISTVVSRKVQVVDLFLPGSLLPECLFSCKSLVNLTLRGCVGIPDCSSVVCLPSLKKLHLYYVDYQCRDETLPHLISGCSVLEELFIEGILEYDLVHCRISSSTIKCLKVNFHIHDKEVEVDPFDYRLEIDAPAVRYLKVEDSLSKQITARTLTSLVEADICIENKYVNEDEAVYSSNVLEFVDKLSNVERLKLSIVYTQLLDSAFASSTMSFGNLIKLELSADWHFITKFLESADNLQVLIISKVDKNLKCWIEPQQVPSCLSSRLTTITIDQFGCAEDYEFEMVRYLLKNAQVLKGMKICCQSTAIDIEGLQRISRFQRGSVACELDFC